MENGKWEMGAEMYVTHPYPISYFPFPPFELSETVLKPSLDDTLALMRDLRKRCDWDAAQTHESLRPYLIEEANEVDEALMARDDARLREELGDLLLQILFHSVIAEERGAFSLHDVAETFITKMKGRHPHLYGEGVKEPWERMKAKKRESIVEGLPHRLPSLHRAYRLQDRAAGVGFDWPTTAGPVEKVREELDEVIVELEHLGDAPRDKTPRYDQTHDRLQDEIGDLLFAVVNLARKAGVHPALALDRSNQKFAERFAKIERLAKERGISVADAGLAILDSLWDEVKRSEKSGP
jgi:MazG family protein